MPWAAAKIIAAWFSGLPGNSITPRLRPSFNTSVIFQDGDLDVVTGTDKPDPKLIYWNDGYFAEPD